MKNKSTKNEVFTKYEVLRKDNDIVSFKEVVTSYDVNEITNKHKSMKEKINDVNKLHSNYNNLITFTTGANKKEYAIIRDYEKDTLIINRIDNSTIYLNSIDLSINNYLSKYLDRHIYYYNNDNVIVIR